MLPLRGAAVAIGIPIALILVLASAVIFAADSPVLGPFSGLMLIVMATYAAFHAVLAVRSGPRPIRKFWAIVAAGLTASIFGNVIWAPYAFGTGGPPISSFADVFYVATSVLYCFAMLNYPVDAKLRSRLRSTLEGVTAGLCLLLLSWVFALRHVIANYGSHKVALTLALTYPISAVATLAITVGILICAPAGHRTVLWILTASFTVSAIATNAYAWAIAEGGYLFGGVLEIAWVTLGAGLAIAAIVSRESAPLLPRPDAPIPCDASLLLPYVPLFLAGTIGALVVLDGVPQILVPLIVIAVCLRQTVAAWDNRRLLRATTEQALRDPLTGLANRALFHDRLAHTLMQRLDADHTVSVVSVNLDDFRMVNENIGHGGADRLLGAVGRRIAENVGSGDTVARLGGDAYAVILEGPSEQACLTAGRIAEAFDVPFVVAGQELLIRASVGVALAPPAERELSAERLMARADVAMYAAKRTRTSRIRTYGRDTEPLDPDLFDVADRRPESVPDGAAKVRLLGELRRAVEQRQLTVFYQPKFDMRTQALVGVEALLRWPHPTQGLLTPGSFLLLIQEHGLMRPVTDLVVDTALTDVCLWRACGAEIPVAVNLSAQSLHDAELPDRLFAALSGHGLPKNVLTAEVTEDMVLSDIALVSEVLQRLRNHGISVSVDDFGSGYSALSYLRDLPIDEIKLDRHFVAPVTEDARAAAVARAVIDLAHGLGMRVVAEGIEDASTADWLRDNNCDIGQGYFLGMPMPADQIPAVAIGLPQR